MYWIMCSIKENTDVVFSTQVVFRDGNFPSSAKVLKRLYNDYMYNICRFSFYAPFCP